VNEEALAPWGLLRQKKEKYSEDLMPMTDAISVLFVLQVLISQGCCVFQSYITCDFYYPSACRVRSGTCAFSNAKQKTYRGTFKPHGVPQIVLTTNIAHMAHLQAI